ncbi:hypothetical protein CgunFtcFv8_023860 [Champsocephalus gunnari]|uniref:Uncharacterized protein n=1 Tax=Champsocephalus gunnari TaxID=52237 RepID=A0AAN8HLL3_CHAGU|nr:hypothetical protein CgunFtcFv8_023860 [Champsocephalus gunnari]
MFLSEQKRATVTNQFSHISFYFSLKEPGMQWLPADRKYKDMSAHSAPPDKVSYVSVRGLDLQAVLYQLWFIKEYVS